MNKQKRKWLEYPVLAGVAGFLLLTDAGKSTIAGLRQLLLKTGIKNAPTETKTDSFTNSPAHGGYPRDLSLRTLEGQTIQPSELRGKVVFLNQWATRCLPGRNARHPEALQIGGQE